MDAFGSYQIDFGIHAEDKQAEIPMEFKYMRHFLRLVPPCVFQKHYHKTTCMTI